jgi:hypothetical protein
LETLPAQFSNHWKNGVFLASAPRRFSACSFARMSRSIESRFPPVRFRAGRKAGENLAAPSVPQWSFQRLEVWASEVSNDWKMRIARARIVNKRGGCASQEQKKPACESGGR